MDRLDLFLREIPDQHDLPIPKLETIVFLGRDEDGPLAPVLGDGDGTGERHVQIAADIAVELGRGDFDGCAFGPLTPRPTRTISGSVIGTRLRGVLLRGHKAMKNLGFKETHP